LVAEKTNVWLTVPGDEGPVRVLIENAESLGIAEVAGFREKLTTRLGEGKLSEKDLHEGGLTISDLGEFGINMFIPIVVPGQCSILGVGKVAQRCVPAGDGVEVREMMNLTIAVDHKVANGAEAAGFLDFIKKMLENSNNLV
jgi:pyruvate dehydrogenase E2 component (dihydrolipoamide acetyltransferase)